MHRRVSLTCGLVIALSGLSSADIFGTEVGSDTLVHIDPSNLSGSVIGPYSSGSYNIQGLAGNAATGELWGLSAGTGQLYSLDAATGASNAITSGFFGGNANGLAYDANRNRLWVSANSGLLAYHDLGTGVNNIVGFAPMGDLEGLAFDAASDTLYALSDSDDRLYTIDTTSLAMTAISGDLGSGTWRGLTYDPSTGRLVASSVGLITYVREFDLATGQFLNSGLITGVGGFVQGLAFIPAPGVLGALATAGLLMRRRR